MTDEREQIGSNYPPEPTPFEAIKTRIEDLYSDAKGWLDGEPVKSQAQADELNKLIGLISEAAAEADALRVTEAKPFDEAKAEIQTRYNLLIGKTKSVTGKTVLAIDAAKKALTPWLQKLDDEKRETERVARETAEKATNEAREAFAKVASDDLAGREAAEALLQTAKQAEIVAKVAAKDTAKAKGGEFRATGLRSFWRAEITDSTVFARWAWLNRRPEVDGFFTQLAQKTVDQNHDQTIPGVTIHEDRKAV